MNDKVHCGPFLPQRRQVGALGWGAYGLNHDGSTDDKRDQDNHAKAALIATARVPSEATKAGHGGTTMLDRSLLTGIDSIDLKMVQKKLLDPDEGEGHRLGWTAAYCERVVEEYRRYLALARRYPDETLVPSHAVDKVWHMHILDTLAYVTDCERVFGYFLHHFPYLGMRGAQDQAEHISYRDRTLALYREHFGEPPPEVWDLTARPPKCGAPQRPGVQGVLILQGIEAHPAKCGAPSV